MSTEAKAQKPLEALEREGWGNFFHMQEPVCPHCGTEVVVSRHDMYHLYEEGEHEVDCPYCELPFMVSTRVNFHFNTDSQP